MLKAGDTLEAEHMGRRALAIPWGRGCCPTPQAEQCGRCRAARLTAVLRSLPELLHRFPLRAAPGRLPSSWGEQNKILFIAGRIEEILGS